MMQAWCNHYIIHDIIMMSCLCHQVRILWSFGTRKWIQSVLTLFDYPNSPIAFSRSRLRYGRRQMSVKACDIPRFTPELAVGFLKELIVPNQSLDPTNREWRLATYHGYPVRMKYEDKVNLLALVRCYSVLLSYHVPIEWGPWISESNPQIRSYAQIYLTCIRRDSSRLLPWPRTF